MRKQLKPEHIPNRKIVGFHRDDLGDWVADLECGHAQHLRHNPPGPAVPGSSHPRVAPPIAVLRYIALFNASKAP
jgi:hypothetical protein